MPRSRSGKKRRRSSGFKRRKRVSSRRASSAKCRNCSRRRYRAAIPVDTVDTVDTTFRNFIRTKLTSNACDPKAGCFALTAMWAAYLTGMPEADVTSLIEEAIQLQATNYSSVHLMIQPGLCLVGVHNYSAWFKVDLQSEDLNLEAYFGSADPNEFVQLDLDARYPFGQTLVQRFHIMVGNWWLTHENLWTLYTKKDRGRDDRSRTWRLFSSPTSHTDNIIVTGLTGRNLSPTFLVVRKSYHVYLIIVNGNIKIDIEDDKPVRGQSKSWTDLLTEIRSDKDPHTFVLFFCKTDASSSSTGRKRRLSSEGVTEEELQSILEYDDIVEVIKKINSLEYENE